MPIPSEGLDAHFLPSARQTANAKRVIRFSAKALRGVQKLRLRALSSCLFHYGCRREKKKRKKRSLYSPCSKCRAFMRSNASMRMQPEETHEDKRTNLRTLLTANSLFNLVYACIVIHKLLHFLPPCRIMRSWLLDINHKSLESYYDDLLSFYYLRRIWNYFAWCSFYSFYVYFWFYLLFFYLPSINNFAVFNR